MITLDEAVERFLLRYDNRQTVLAYRRALNPFRSDFGPHRMLASITPEDVDDWNKTLRCHQPPLAPWTLATRRKRLKCFFNWCVEREYLHQSPARFLLTAEPRTVPGTKAIPTDVVLAMLEAARTKEDLFIRARDTAVLALMMTFGARVGDVSRLSLPYVTAGWIIFDVKGGADHRLPMPPETWKLLAYWLEMRRALDLDPAHEFVFTNNRLTPGTRYGPFTVGGIATLVRRLSEDVCGQAYGPHSIRHWFAQSSADAGVPATVIQHILGHRSVETTLKHYFNQDYDRIRQVLERGELGKQRRPENPPAPPGNIIPFPLAV